MKFDEKIVAEAVDLLKGFAAERDLGAPIKVMSYVSPWPNNAGVGCEWPNEVRNAVRLDRFARTYGELEATVHEAVRRLREWVHEGANDVAASYDSGPAGS